MSYLTTCPNCEKDLGYVPKWEPGEKCPYCGYSPPFWQYWVVFLGLILLVGIGLWISKSFLGNSPSWNIIFPLIFVILVFLMVLWIGGYLVEKFSKNPARVGQNITSNGHFDKTKAYFFLVIGLIATGAGIYQLLPYIPQGIDKLLLADNFGWVYLIAGSANFLVGIYEYRK